MKPGVTISCFKCPLNHVFQKHIGVLSLPYGWYELLNLKEQSNSLWIYRKRHTCFLPFFLIQSKEHVVPYYKRRSF